MTDLTVCQDYSRSKEDGIVSREEWLSNNEYDISDLWEGLNSYLEYKNQTFLLDKCTYQDFSDFVAKFSNHYSSEDSNSDEPQVSQVFV